MERDEWVHLQLDRAGVPVLPAAVGRVGRRRLAHHRPRRDAQRHRPVGLAVQQPVAPGRGRRLPDRAGEHRRRLLRLATWRSHHGDDPLHGGQNGATISDLQIRATPLGRDPDTDFVTARNAASVAKWDARQVQYQTWEFIDRANAQALGDSVVDYGGQPRRSFTLRLDGDRDPATLAASYLELSSVVTCNVDADLNQDGEIVRVEHYIGEGETPRDLHDAAGDGRGAAGADDRDRAPGVPAAPL